MNDQPNAYGLPRYNAAPAFSQRTLNNRASRGMQISQALRLPRPRSNNIKLPTLNGSTSNGGLDRFTSYGTGSYFGSGYDQNGQFAPMQTGSPNASYGPNADLQGYAGGGDIFAGSKQWALPGLRRFADGGDVDVGADGLTDDQRQQIAAAQTAQEQMTAGLIPQPSTLPEQPGVTQPGTLLGQLQGQRYNPSDPTAGNVAPDATSKLLGAGATALPMVALGPAASAASMGAQAATKEAGAPQPVQDIAGLLPYFAGGIGELPTQNAYRGLAGGMGETLTGQSAPGVLKTLTEAGGAGLGQYGGNQVDKALNLPDIPLVGGPAGAIGAGMGGMLPGFARDTAASIASSALPGMRFQGAAPDMPNDVSQATMRLAERGQAAPSGAAMTPDEMRTRLETQGLNPADNPMIAGSSPQGLQDQVVAAQRGAARNSYSTSLERSGDPGQATIDARRGAVQRGDIRPEVEPGTAPLDEPVDPALAREYDEAARIAAEERPPLGVAGETGGAPRPLDVNSGTAQTSPATPNGPALDDTAIHPLQDLLTRANAMPIPDLRAEARSLGVETAGRINRAQVIGAISQAYRADQGLTDAHLQDISKRTGIGLGALRTDDPQGILEDRVAEARDYADLFKNHPAQAYAGDTLKAQAYGNSMRLNAYQKALDAYFPDSALATKPVAAASPDIAAQQTPQQTPQAPRALAPNEVGSVSEASNPPPPELRGPVAQVAGNTVTPAPGPPPTEDELTARIAAMRPTPRAGATTATGASTQPVAPTEATSTAPGTTLPPMSEGEINARGRAEAAAVQQGISDLKGMSDAALINRANAAGVTTGQAPLDANGNILQSWKDNIAAATAFVERNKATGGQTQALMDAKPTSVGEQMSQHAGDFNQGITPKLDELFGPNAANGRFNPELDRHNVIAAGAQTAQNQAGWQAMQPAGAGGGRGGTTSGPASTPPAPRGVDTNLWHNAASAVTLPLRTLLTGGHFLRVGVGTAVAHPTRFADAIKGWGAAVKDPAVIPALRAAVDNEALPAGVPKASSFRTSGQPVNPTFVDTLVNRVPVVGNALQRLGNAGPVYLGLLRDGAYNDAAKFLNRVAPDADPKMYKDIYNTLSHSTGHSTLPLLKGNGVAQSLGIGPQALASRFQSLADPIIKSGAPVPWAAGARAEAMKNLIGVAGVMALTDVLGQALGAKVSLPFNAGPVKATDLTTPFGVESKLFKATSVNPEGTYKTVYSGGSGYDTLFRLFGNIGLDIAKEGANPINNASLQGHLAGWMRGELGPVPSTALDLVLGSDWRGDPYGPRGGDAGTKAFMNDLSHGFIEKWAPIAAQNIVGAVNAWGPSGVLRAAPSLGGYEASTEPTTSGEKIQSVIGSPDRLGAAFPNNPGMAAALKDADPSSLTRAEKTALQGQMTPEQQQAMEEHAQALRDKGDVFQKGRDFSDQAHDTVDSIHKDYAGAIDQLQQRLMGGKEDPHHVEQLISAVRKDMNEKIDAAYKPSNDYYNSPEYQNAVAKLPANNSELQPYLDAYRSLGDRPAVKTPNGFVDTGKLQQLQQMYVDGVKQAHPDLGARLEFNTQKDDSWKPPILDFFDNSVRPAANQYFDLPQGTRTQWAREHPQEEAILNVAGYLPQVHSAQAADYVHRLAPDRNVTIAR